MKNLTFTKAEALSNDFIIVDDRETGSMSFVFDQITELCNRRLGIGADGILLLQPSETADFKMRTLNSDGSEAEMCGNGIRCAAKFAFDSGSKGLRSIETLAGIINVLISAGEDGTAETIRVDLGVPLIEQLSQEVMAAGQVLDVTCVSMGNPHAVMFVDDVAAAGVEIIGPAVEGHEFFPNKTNVEFIRVIDGTTIDMRVWERGAGETAACGTGAAAALAAAHSRGLIGRAATLKLLGGDLKVEWADDGHIFITGGARMVFSGQTGVNR